MALPVFALEELKLVGQLVIVPLFLSEIVYFLLKGLHEELLVLGAGGLASSGLYNGSVKWQFTGRIACEAEFDIVIVLLF